MKYLTLLTLGAFFLVALSVSTYLQNQKHQAQTQKPKSPGDDPFAGLSAKAAGAQSEVEKPKRLIQFLQISYPGGARIETEIDGYRVMLSCTLPAIDPYNKGGWYLATIGESAQPYEIVKLYHKDSELLLGACSILGKMPADAFPLKVFSSRFQQWTDGTGYRLWARSPRVLYELACTSLDKFGPDQTPRCGSVQPGRYRAALGNSALWIYDMEDLGLIGVYTILSAQEGVR